MLELGRKLQEIKQEHQKALARIELLEAVLRSLTDANKPVFLRGVEAMREEAVQVAERSMIGAWIADAIRSLPAPTDKP
jgi:hypothetical protein